MFVKGGLIDRLSKPTKVLKLTTTTSDLGAKQKSYTPQKEIQMYITSTDGQREDIENRFGLVQQFVGQTTELNAGIEINDLLEQDGKVYRVDDIDENAANVGIEAEYILVRTGKLQDEQQII